MVVVIPAAGAASRMRSLIGDRPKALVEVGGRPLLAHVLDNAVSLGASRICVVTRDSVLQETFGSVWQGIPVSYCKQGESYGLGAAVRAAAGWTTDPFGLIVGDLYTQAPLHFDPNAHLGAGADGVVGISDVPSGQAHRYAVVSTDSQGFVTHIEEKPENPTTRWVEVGIYLLPAMIVQAPTFGGPDEEDQLQPMENWLTKNGYRLQAAPLPSDWVNVNTPEDLEQARSLAAASACGP